MDFEISDSKNQAPLSQAPISMSDSESKKSSPLYDEDCELRCFIMEPNLVIPWLLMASYAYYIEDDPILSDAMYDQLSRYAAKHYAVLVHWHKQYVPAPEEGSVVIHLHTLAEYEYPARAVAGLYHIRRYGANPVDTAIEVGMVAS
jgi:hypothetical protein